VPLTTKADEELARFDPGQYPTPPDDPRITSLVLNLSGLLEAVELEEHPASTVPPRPVKKGTAAKDPAPLRNVRREILRLIASLIRLMGPSFFVFLMISFSASPEKKL
jgi:hypothetical protein